MSAANCSNCGNSFEGNYCNQCGEKKYNEHDKSLSHFFYEAVHFFTHLDNKYFTTLALIFRKPGTLSLSYCDGIRSKYFKPFSLFFIGVILYLLFPFLPGLNMSFAGNLQNLEAQRMTFILDLVHNKAEAGQLGMEALGELYDHKSPAIAKLMLLIVLPLTGVILKLMFFRRKKYFLDHVILATEASSVMLYLNFFLLPLLFAVPLFLLKKMGVHTFSNLGDNLSMPIYGSFLVFWATIAFKKFYRVSTLTAILKGILFLLAQSVVIFIIYRLILFLTVLLFI